ncbi:MAG: hypothetical protein IPK10_12470 [Bacteroidetes bacterium]|nr:hypothetical protein [Bacteroidota bacterium]
MKKFSLLFVFTLLSLQLYAQNEGKNWYFGGSGAGLDFYSCSDSAFINGNGLHFFEGSVSMSDEQTGQLLFYSNGKHIFNANHDTMINGYEAGLSNSITQNIALKKPGSTHLYYLFTADVQGGITSNPAYPNAFGINYAEIDMSLAGGLGAVTSKFNSLKDTSNCEKLTAVQHANGQDIWLIGHEYGYNNFFVYSITANAIDTTPLIFSTGPVIYTPQPGIQRIANYDAVGELKASPDGSKLAFTTYYNGITALFDFDNATGSISNPIPLNINDGGYGVSFSPNGTKLYIGAIDTAANFIPAHGKILQFDLSSGNPTIIQSSKFVVFNLVNCGFSSMKLSINGTIIVSHYGNSGQPVGDGHLGKIRYPDSLGNACGYLHNAIHLKGRLSSWGLNNQMENPNYCIPTATIENATLHNSISVFPNPTTGEFMVTYPFLEGEKL